jgi:hypothetical protein
MFSGRREEPDETGDPTSFLFKLIALFTPSLGSIADDCIFISLLAWLVCLSNFSLRSRSALMASCKSTVGILSSGLLPVSWRTGLLICNLPPAEAPFLWRPTAALTDLVLGTVGAVFAQIGGNSCP